MFNALLRRSPLDAPQPRYKFTLSIAIVLILVNPLHSAEIFIKSKYVKSAVVNPLDKLWNSIPSANIPLYKQNLVVPYGGGTVSEIEIKSIYTNKEIFIMVSWKDETKDSKISQVEKFSDAVAIEFPVNKNSLPSPIMGEKDNPVNIWLWKASFQEKEKIESKAYSDFYRNDAIENVLKPIHSGDNLAENLIAGGFGTLTHLPIQDIKATGIWKSQKWHVVFKKEFNSASVLGTSESGSKINKNLALPVAFAVWNGSNKERDGIKSMSFWNTIIIGKAEIFKPKDKISAGERVFARFGCVTCHGKSGKEPVPNFNAKGEKTPALTKVKEGYSSDELKEFIRKGKIPDKEDPLGPHPSLRMNAWKGIIDEKELDALKEYLFSLFPKTKKDEW